MEANACFFAVSLGPQFNTRSQPQPGAFAYTSTVSFHMVCYRSSFCANNRLNANPYNGSTRKFSLTFASDQSSETPSVADRVEDFAGALPGNEQVDGAVKFKKDFDGKSLKPMGLSVERELKPLSVKDYLDRARDMIKLENDTLHWFSPVECGCPPQNAPLLLFLPGMDGTGLGLIMHHQTLGELFQIRCLHIPVMDRTPFEGLVEYVEETLKLEHEHSPMRPIYLVGDSFGGCLALAIAACNPEMDLVLILSNPATSLNKSQWQPFLPLLESMPIEFHSIVPYLLSFVTGDPVRMAMANIDDKLPALERTKKLSDNLADLWPRISILADIVPKETLTWKIKLLRSAALYANSRLHAVRAEVLVLASSKDQMLNSGEEAKRLKEILPYCIVRNFKDSGHTLLLEEGINLATIIKSTSLYRSSRKLDYVLDFIPPTPQEFRKTFEQQYVWFQRLTSPVMFSTLEDNKILKGLMGIPHDGPVLFVGYHMLQGLELVPLIGEFLTHRDVLLRGVAHPFLFSKTIEELMDDKAPVDLLKLFGGVPVSGKNLFRLLSSKSFALLYPGGAREALHRKGEQYKLFWPERSEFVRMAARFGATIIPFGVIGEDDVAEMILDYNDLMKIPYMRDYIGQMNEGIHHLRSDMPGEISNQTFHIPWLAPKIPGRMYYLFRRPISTIGRRNELQDKDQERALYLHIKAEVEAAMSYLQEKRKEDPYRNFLPRFLCEATLDFKVQAPTFEP